MTHLCAQQPFAIEQFLRHRSGGYLRLQASPMPDSQELLDSYLDPETGILRNLVGARARDRHGSPARSQPGQDLARGRAATHVVHKAQAHLITSDRPGDQPIRRTQRQRSSSQAASYGLSYTRVGR